MGGWTEFMAAFVVFFASHRLLVMAPVKEPLVRVLGAGGFTLAYSLMSALVLAWIIVAAGRAPYIELWEHQGWMNHATLTLMALASVIFAMSLGRPNPLSFGGLHDERFDPRHPGLVGWMRHPLLVVLGLWSLGHLLVNGNLAHVIMFGAFFLFAIAGHRIIDRRKRRLLGAEQWARLAAARRVFEPSLNGLVRVGLGLALYGVLLWLHGPVIGVYPLAF